MTPPPQPAEGPPMPELHARAGAAIRALHAAWCEGETAGDDPAGLLQALRRWRRAAGRPLRLELHGGDFFANGRYVRLDAWTLDRALELAEHLARARVGLVEFPDRVDADTVRALLACLDARLRGGTECVDTPVRVAPAAPGAHPARPDPLADLAPAVAGELRGLHDGGRDLRPLLHLLVVVAQNARIRPEMPPPGTTATHATLEAVTFATWLGLGARDAVLAGLAVAIRLLAGREPPVLVALRHEGLGRLGAELPGVVAAADPDRPPPVDARARVAALVLAFRRLRAGSVSTDAALLALVRDWGEDGRALAAWRGSRTAVAPEVDIEDEDEPSTAITAATHPGDDTPAPPHPPRPPRR